jgi:hypothetical protein
LKAISARAGRPASVTLAGILALALALRLGLFLFMVHDDRKFYAGDTNSYELPALNLLNHGVFSSEPRPPYTPELSRTPGYPAYLALVYGLFGRRPALAIAGQILLGSLSVWLTYWLARQCGLPAGAGLLAAALMAVDFMTNMEVVSLLTETVFTALLLASLCLLLRYCGAPRWPWLLASAGLIALAALTRPIAQALPLLLLPVFWLAAPVARRRAALLAGLTFAGLSLGLINVWAARNYARSGDWTLSTIADDNLLYYRARDVLAEVQGRPQDEVWSDLEREVNQVTADRRLSVADTSAYMRQRALGVFLHYPAATARMTLAGLARILADPGFSRVCTVLNPASETYDCVPGRGTMNGTGVLQTAWIVWSGFSWLQRAALAWGVIGLAATYGLGVLGALALIRNRRLLAALLLIGLVVFFCGLSAGAEANARFRVVVMPMLAILAGQGGLALRAFVAARRARTF